MWPDDLPDLCHTLARARATRHASEVLQDYAAHLARESARLRTASRRAREAAALARAARVEAKSAS